MSVSLARAEECIGRRVLHENKNVRGVVASTDLNDVWVKTDDGDIIPCIPAHLSWISTLSVPLRDALNNWEAYESAQVGFSPWVWKADEVVEPFPNLGIVYSSGTANDDGMDRALYAVAPMLRKVQVLSITANPETAWEIEEVLGWTTA